ncbi:MAG: pectin esterase [Bacteroidaceae bacterium]|nr:pectin esterase [Bacteroidaceae bacterium]
MKKSLICLLMALITLTAFKEGEKKITVFMIGDSTMANKSITGGKPERGWGHVLGGFFTEDIIVDNHAVNGRSSKSFIDEGRWDKVLSRIKPGDYVVIQFGHNDEKPNPDRHTDPGTTFDANLSRFVNEARERGANPILMNAIVRRNFIAPKDPTVSEDARPDASKSKEKVEGDTLYDTHGTYLDSPRNVAKKLNVPFVDANKITHELVQGLGREESKKLFMWVEPNTVPAVPKGSVDNTHLNVYGARVVAGLLVDAMAEAVPALAPYVRHYDFVVAKDGSGDFFTVQEAINAVPDFRKEGRTTIYIRKGVYKEKLIIPESKINVSLIGAEGAVISGDDYASKPNRFGENMSTSGSSSCYIYAPDLICENLTFENTAGRVGQAVACFVSGDKVIFRNCRFLGNQDTLYNFGKHCRQYFENCYIEGTVDFIFGSSTAVFNRCTIHSLSKGYLTAPSTPQDEAYGYVFIDCRLTAADGVEKVYLARPWRPYGKSVFIHCEMDDHILPVGWHNWNKKDAEKTCFFAEYENTGAGAATKKERAKFSHQLKNLKGYSIEEILAGEDGWNPLAK